MKSTENSDASLQWYTRRIEYMAQFMLPERLQTLSRVLQKRTRYMTVCMENTFHPQNASALVRTCEAFGIQDIHAVESLCKFNPNVNIVKGTDKWITMHRYKSTSEALAELKSRGYRIVVTSPHEGGFLPDTFDVSSGRFALFFGTEHAGVSQEAMAAADAFVQIPMYGFVESLNVSASAAILLCALSGRLREGSQDWRLSEAEHAELMLDWIMKSVKDSRNILSKQFQKDDGTI